MNSFSVNCCVNIYFNQIINVNSNAVTGRESVSTSCCSRGCYDSRSANDNNACVCRIGGNDYGFNRCRGRQRDCGTGCRNDF